MKEKIKDNQQYLLQGESDPEYNPYKVPADINASRLHSKAKRVGIPIGVSQRFCSCCNFPIENKQISLRCNEKELAFLGSAYPFYFRYCKSVAILIIVLLFMGLFSSYFTYHRGECVKYCLKLFGFTIFSDGDLSTQLNSMSWYNLFTTIIMLIIIFNIKGTLYSEMRSFNEGLQSSSRFTLMVQNISKQAKKSELKEYFEKLTKSKVEKINLAYNIERYRKYFIQKLKLIHRMTKQKNNYQDLNFAIGKLSDEIKIQRAPELNEMMTRIKEMEGEIIYLDNKMQEFENSCEEEKSENFTGTAFVTFSNQLPIKVLLDHYGVTYLRNLKYLLFNRWTHPYLKFKSKCLIIHRAPEPTDLIWENLEFSFWKAYLHTIFMYFASVAILVLSFYIQWSVVKVIYAIRVEQNISIFSDSWIIKLKSLLSSIFIASTNFLLRITVYYFTLWQRHYSNTKQNKAYINVYVLLSFFNSALMPYLINTLVNHHSSFQLVLDIHFILMTNAIATPICRVFDMMYFYRIIKRVQIIRWGKSCTYPQDWVNYYFENPTMDIADSYSYMSRLLLVSAWFASAAPMGIVMSLIGLTATYWIDKTLLLRFQSTPSAQNEDIISSIVNILELIPYIYIFGAIEYTVRIVVSENLVDFVVTFMVYAISSLSLVLTLVIYFCFYKKSEETKPFDQNLEYSGQSLNLFGEYERVNPITQKVAFYEFIKELKAKSGEDNNSRAIIEMVRRVSKVRRFTKSIDRSTSNNIVTRGGSFILDTELEILTTPRNLIS